MIATIEGTLRGIREISSEKGKLFIHIMEFQDRAGLPYLMDVVSTKNGRKNGPVSLKVSIGLRRDKAGLVTGLKMWEV